MLIHNDCSSPTCWRTNQRSCLWSVWLLTLTASMSQYCANQASHRRHVYMPRSGDYSVRTGNKRSATTQKLTTWCKDTETDNLVQRHWNWQLGATTQKLTTWTIWPHSAKNCKRTGSEIKKLWAFKDGDCTFGARVSKTAGARSGCIPGLLALKGLILTQRGLSAPKALAICYISTSILLLVATAHP